jgi:hypothetical protein
MTDAVIADADTYAVAKRKLAQPDVDGVDAELMAQLVEQARSAGLQLTGEGGLLQQLTKRVLESALDGEIIDHLGYDKGDPASKNCGNSRNGVRVLTADTYTSVLLDLHFKTAEATARLVLKAAARNPGQRYRSKTGHRNPQQQSRPPGRNRYAPTDPAPPSGPKGPHTRDTHTTHKDQDRIAR